MSREKRDGDRQLPAGNVVMDKRFLEGLCMMGDAKMLIIIPVAGWLTGWLAGWSRAVSEGVAGGRVEGLKV